MTAPLFCNLILADTDRDIVGLKRFCEGLKQRGVWDLAHLTVLLHADKARWNDPGQKRFFRGLLNQGHEIGVWFAGMRPAIARWLDIPEAQITACGFQLFSDTDLEEQARLVQAGFLTGANACIEGDSHKEELWDIPHNWEGAPCLPYWVQWDADQPESACRVGRELTKRNAVLELQWATRTLWHNIDRICLPQCFHFGEPAKHTQWIQGPLVRKGDIRWWQDELCAYEENVRTGRAPFAYINTASEANVFTPGGPWAAMLDVDTALQCALDLVEWMIGRGWRMLTCREFYNWFTRSWPCPSAPSAAFLMPDTLGGRRDQRGTMIPHKGRMLHAETRYYQVIDHEHRLGPELVIAYGLQTPNLLRAGYTFGDPAIYGPGQNRAQYGSTTGNAIFWSPSEPLTDGNGTPYYTVNKPAEARDRTITLYLGDDWRPYQFCDAAIERVRRSGETLSWTKRMRVPVTGSDIRVAWHHRLQGPEHRIRITVSGKDAIGQPVHLRLCPYFHQGWDSHYGDQSGVRTVPREQAGQERHVFAHAHGTEFEWRTDNLQPRSLQIASPPNGQIRIHVFNRNPGRSKNDPEWTIDDNPLCNRGLTLQTTAPGATIEFLDSPGACPYVTVLLHLGAHRRQRVYEFRFTYWHWREAPSDVSDRS